MPPAPSDVCVNLPAANRRIGSAPSTRSARSTPLKTRSQPRSRRWDPDVTLVSYRATSSQRSAGSVDWAHGLPPHAGPALPRRRPRLPRVRAAPSLVLLGMVRPLADPVSQGDSNERDAHLRAAISGRWSAPTPRPGAPCHERSPGDPNPTAGRVERVRGGGVDGDRRIGSVSTHQIDHSLEQLELIVGLAHPAADDDALPRPGSQGSGDHRLHVVAAVEANRQDSAPTPWSANRVVPTSMASVTGLGSHGPAPDPDRARSRAREAWGPLCPLLKAAS